MIKTKLFLLLLLLFNSSFSAEKEKSDFLSLCKVSFPRNLKNEKLCQSINQKFFSNVKSVDIATFKPTDFNVPPLSIDSKIQYIAFNDPNYVAALAYCYFNFRGWISSDSLTPDKFGTIVSGLSILNEQINEYQEWITKNPKGINCKKKVEQESEFPLVNLANSLKNSVGIIGINPYALITQKDQIDIAAIYTEIRTTIVHERIHAYHVICPEFEKWSINEWQKLNPKAKKEYREKYPSYDWSNIKVAGREYSAYLLEIKENQIAPLIKNCH